MCSQFVVDRPGEAIARGTRTGSIKVAETGARSVRPRLKTLLLLAMSTLLTNEVMLRLGHALNLVVST